MDANGKLSSSPQVLMQVENKVARLDFKHVNAGTCLLSMEERCGNGSCLLQGHTINITNKEIRIKVHRSTFARGLKRAAEST